jgi:plastocyanin
MWCGSAICCSIGAFEIEERVVGCGKTGGSSGVEMSNQTAVAVQHCSAQDKRRAFGRLVLVLLAVAAGAAAAAEPVTISQRNRKFSPDQVTVARGAVLHVVNDDRVTHHVQVEGPGTAFDSGEQPIGTAVDLHFDQPGTFAVHCAIHPTMHLQVTVQ